MKTFLSVVVVLLSGLAGLAFVFTDVLVVGPGFERIAIVAFFYLVVGFLLTRIRGKHSILWAVLSGWGLLLLGLVGTWLSLTDAASGDLPLALLFLVGPGLAAFGGGLLAGDNPASL